MKHDCAVKAACLSLLVLSATLHGCGADSEQPHQPTQPPAGRFIHDPALSRLNPEQLRALSMECEKYSPDGTSRGPYDITYCENAIAAWGDSPLQMVTIPQAVITTPRSVIPAPAPVAPSGPSNAPARTP